VWRVDRHVAWCWFFVDPRVTDNPFGADMWGKLAGHPKFATYLKDPMFTATLQRLQSDPQSLGSGMKDPRVLEVRLSCVSRVAALGCTARTHSAPECPWWRSSSLLLPCLTWSGTGLPVGHSVDGRSWWRRCSGRDR
jgi:hypothetical protein